MLKLESRPYSASQPLNLKKSFAFLISKNAGRLLTLMLTAAALLCLLSFWLFRLEELPGLHGDEAWFGLTANSYSETGIKSPVGMTFYTGILQSLASFITFKYFGIGVFQLRLPGVILNFLTLVIAVIVFVRYQQYRMLTLFMLLVMQSSIFVLYPKLAWEVTTFSCLFLLIQLGLFYIIFTRNRPRTITVFAFLLINLLGSYNHILFASLPLALLIGTCIWVYLNNQVDKYYVTVILAVNLFNICVQGLYLKFLVTDIWISYGNGIFIIAPVLLFIESIFIKQIITALTPILVWIQKMKINPLVFSAFLLLSIITFCIFHGLSTTQVFSNTALITNLFSYQPSESMHLLATTCGLFLFGSFLFLLIKNSVAEDKNLITILIATYLGVFCLFTTGTSIRYYIIPSVFIYLFLAFELNKKNLLRFIPVCILVSASISFIILTIQLTDIYQHSERKVKAIEIIMGNKTMETSAHFLSTLELRRFISDHQIDNVEYDPAERYFIENPISFYKLFQKQKGAAGKSILVKYNYQALGNGFKIKWKK